MMHTMSEKLDNLKNITPHKVWPTFIDKIEKNTVVDGIRIKDHYWVIGEIPIPEQYALDIVTAHIDRWIKKAHKMIPMAGGKQKYLVLVNVEKIETIMMHRTLIDAVKWCTEQENKTSNSNTKETINDAV